MTEPLTAAEVMLAAAKSTLRTMRMAPAQVIGQQLEALRQAGYVLIPPLADDGEAVMLAVARRALLSGRFRPIDIVNQQLDALEGAGHFYQPSDSAGSVACEEFAWGPDSFESCAECGLSFWSHGEGGTDGQPADRPEGV